MSVDDENESVGQKVDRLKALINSMGDKVDKLSKERDDLRIENRRLVDEYKRVIDWKGEFDDLSEVQEIAVLRAWRAALVAKAIIRGMRPGQGLVDWFDVILEENATLCDLVSEFSELKDQNDSLRSVAPRG